MTIPEQAVQAAPCPRCASANVYIEPDERGSGGQWVFPVHIGCSDCGINLTCHEADTVEDAVSHWNNRAAPHLAAVQVKKLEDWHLDQILTGVKSQINHNGWEEPYVRNRLRFELERILSALEPSSTRAAVLEEAAKLADRGNAAWLEKRDVTANKKEAHDYETMAIAYSRVAAAIRALHPQADKPSDDGAQGEGWLPIESAPRDGTVIDLWSDEYGRLTDCYWGTPMAYEGDETGWVHAHSNEWAESPDEFVCWRPLPTPPAGEVA